MRLENLRVAEVMQTAVISAREDDDIRKVAADMRLADVRHVPVVDAELHVVGILSSRDVLRALGRGGTAPIPVAKVMTRTVMTVRPSTPAAVAAVVLLQYKIGALPVVGNHDELVGLVTETDFLRLAVQALRDSEAEVRDEHHPSP